VSRSYEALKAAERKREEAGGETVGKTAESPIVTQQPTRGESPEHKHLLPTPTPLASQEKLLPDEISQVEALYKRKCRPYRLVLRRRPSDIDAIHVWEACQNELGEVTVFLRNIWSGAYYEAFFASGDTRYSSITIVDVYYFERTDS